MHSAARHIKDAAERLSEGEAVASFGCDPAHVDVYVSPLCVLCVVQYADFFSCISGGWIRAPSFRSQNLHPPLCVRTDLLKGGVEISILLSKVKGFRLSWYLYLFQQNLQGNSRAQTLLNSTALHKLPEGSWFWRCCFHPQTTPDWHSG